MITSMDLEARLARFVERHVTAGEHLPVEELCGDRPELGPALTELIERYLSVAAALDSDLTGPPRATRPERTNAGPLPQVEGFQTIERIGAGGMGEVFKLRDLRLNRIVAGKVVRRGRLGESRQRLEAFLREARALALFSDPRIVQIFDARLDSDPPMLLMEFVEGFELGRIGRSLEYAQRARILLEVCEAIHHAHGLGLQHRDLKPSNIMLDAQLVPRVLDFGMSAGDPREGHFAGTLPYVAPEQLDPARRIDARTDIYALGVVLYELLCGRRPYEGDDATIVQQIRGGSPRLPVEIDPSVPEPLQAVALTAMESDPALRYAAAADMAADLRRYLEGRPVLARPSAYATTLGSRIRPHLGHVTDWLALRLIYPHEAERLRSAYDALQAREDDWIVESRVLSFSQIALYLGAFLLIAGSLFYFVAARWFGSVEGVARPFVVLALPFLGLNAAAHLLYRRDHKAVAVAFYLGAIVLLPLFLLIAFHEGGLLVAPPGDGNQIFDGAVSNRQLQVTALVACLWSVWLAARTRTAALSTVFAMLILILTVAVLSDFGLRPAIEAGRWDSVALRFLPLVAAYAALGFVAERRGRPWFSRPLYLGSTAVFVISLELLALDGQAVQRLSGVSLAPWQPAGVSDPTLLDTVAAMTVNGALFYVVGSMVARNGPSLSLPAAHLLFAIAPFALLHPLGYLVRTAEHSPRLDWVYAVLALGIMLLSQRRQRRSFYYAGLLNLAIALYLIAARREWYERPEWAIAVLAAGLAALGIGFALHRREISRR